ncbi:THO complex subunit 2 protein [Rutstroemia sp. NJR-2017a WRK4]|nr:THO complex subunit 2 protein [Rutstroemia sp. NJR-2017a WRK4]
MAPGGKRKRNDRQSVDSGDTRPAPHRPVNASLGQHERQPDMREGGGRRSSRGGQGNQGGGRGRRNDNRSSSNGQSNLTIASRVTPTPGPMSPPPRPSSATQTPAQTPTTISANESMSSNWKPEPSPFDYAFLTDDRVSAWNTTGRQEVVDAGIQARQDEDTMDLSAVFQEYIRAAIDGRIDAGDAGNCVKEILGPDTAPADDIPGTFDPQTLFLDSLSMICESEDLKASAQQLRTFAFATNIPAVVMRQKLDAALLLNLGLTRDTFTRIGIRQATHLLYRQANYNLLREETEGYSKLVTELFTICGSEPPNSDLVEDAFEKVKGLIGTFDLDVGRVLDITLDVFAAVLIKHFRFFIKLLRVSSWWPRSGETDGRSLTRCGGLPGWALPTFPGYLPTPEDEELAKQKRDARDKLFWERAREIGIEAFFELGGRELVDTEEKERLLKAESDAALDADRQWIKTTGTYPPSGNKTAAQLLGFKLRFYASSARDNEDVLPANLIYLTALLIKIGFISLKDLYPHLWPLDEDMGAVRDAKMKEIEEKEKTARGGTMNALMMAGALVDDTLPNGGKTREITSKDDPSAKATAEVDDKDKLDDPIDQKVQLLTCLLTIGAIPESLFILGRFPWLPEAYPELLDLIHRILNHSIQHVFDMSRPTSTVDAECLNKEIVDYDQSGMPKGSLRLLRLPPRKQLRWPFADKFDTNENNSYRFYWDEWADNVPVCQTVDNVFTLCGSLLNYSGVNIGKDSSLLSKLARIGTKSLSEDHSTQNLDRWQDLLKRLLVPALSLTKANTSVVNEVYGMLRFYPIAIRYSIYAEWFEGQISRLPAMRAAFARTKAETTSTMKRISMTNLTSMARNLAKIAYASPGVVYSVALGQIEAYTNLTEVVVECAKYFTDLGYDVLVWSLLSSLGGKDRNRNDSEFALLPSKWLLALSRFSGKVFKRYSIMNLIPLIQYVNDQLHRGNATDLVILKELIAQMSGIVPDTDFNDAQLAAMTGGELLRRQTLINLQDKRYESVKTAKRLMRALTDTKLGGQLLLSIAQHRQSAIYTVPDDEAPIKLLATMVDDTQMILFQYLDLLRSNLSVEEFDSLVPGISELMKDFGLDPSLAFMIGRASVTHRLARLPAIHVNGTTKTPADNKSPEVDNDGDVGMDANEEPTADSKTPPPNGADTPEEDVQMTDAKIASSSSEVASSEADPLLELLSPYMKTAEEVLPEDSWASLTSEFYVLFWLTTLSDLAIPSHSYEAEISRLLKEQGDVMKDRTDMSRAGMAKKEEAKKALAATRENLLAEFGKQVGSFSGKKGRLLKRKNFWFKNVKHDLVSDSILERCLLPRILLSPSDADFCFRMIRFLHDNGTPNFRTLSLYSRLFRSNRLRSMIFTCTVREAENLGRFLRLVLTDLARWHSDRATYEKEAWGPSQNLPGFAKAFDQDGNMKGLLAHDEKVGFKNILYSWHQKLNAALRDCLGGTEWMHIRNAMTILKSVVDVFPAVNFMGNNFVKQLETIATREKGVREDLSLAGNAILVQLKKKSKSWIMVQAFGYSLNDPTQGSNSPAPEANRPGPAVSKTVLKATAPEFKPQSRASSMGVSTPKAPATTEVEDGEVDDAKNASTNNPKDNTSESSRNDTRPPPTQGGNDGKKSEILLRREKILRENAARSATPTPPPSSIPPRPDIQRNLSANHTLPNRPDVPLPNRQMLDRHLPRQDDRRDVRDNRLPDLVRDRGRDRGREFPPGDRRAMDAGPRDFRGSDRVSVAERDRSRPDSIPRWTGEPGRDNTDRGSNGYKPVDNSGRLSRDIPMAPPKSTVPERGPPVNPERLPLVNPERQEMINPERAALISGGNESSRSDSPRRGREETRDRSSRQNSPPRRHGADRDPQDPRRDERSSRNVSMDIHGSASRSRPDDSQPPPAGPRGERLPDRNNDRAPPPERLRDASNFQPTQQPPRPVDLDHGRLSRPQQQADPNFGRLNQNSDIPSGPRDRNTRNNRTANAPQARRDGRQPNGGAVDIPRPPTPDKQPPTGPSGGGRHPRRTASTSIATSNSSGQYEAPSAAPSNLPPTPVALSPTTAIHPDRLKHLGAQVTQPQPPPTVASAPTTAGMHPDRLRSFGGSVATNNAPPQDNARPRPTAPPLQTQNPPVGPKSQNSPASQRMNGPPTGPASATERPSRGRNPNATILSNINRHMVNEDSNKPTQGQERNPRGRRHGQAQTPVSGPSTPILPPPPPPGPPPAQTRDAGRDLVNPERADLIGNNTPNSDDRNRGERDRSSRHDRSGRSRRSSPDRNRDQKRGPQEDERPDRGDHRSRGSDRSSRDTERERHPRGEPSGGGRDLMGGSGSGREHRDRDSSRRDGRGAERDSHESGGGSGNWANGSDNRSERRSQRSERSDRSDDRGMRDRKRRSDGDGLREGGPEKRPRR